PILPGSAARPLVHEMDRHAVEPDPEMRVPVQRPLPGPPVEPVRPVPEQPAQVPEIGALLPRRTGSLVRPAGVPDAGAEVGEHLVGHVDLEWLHRYSSPASSGNTLPTLFTR